MYKHSNIYLHKSHKLLITGLHKSHKLNTQINKRTNVYVNKYMYDYRNMCIDA